MVHILYKVVSSYSKSLTPELQKKSSFLGSGKFVALQPTPLGSLLELET